MVDIYGDRDDRRIAFLDSEDRKMKPGASKEVKKGPQQGGRGNERGSQRFTPAPGKRIR